MSSSALSTDPMLSVVPILNQSLDMGRIRTWISTTIKPLSKFFTAHEEYGKFYILLFKSLSFAIEDKLWNARFPSLAPTFLERVLYLSFKFLVVN